MAKYIRGSLLKELQEMKLEEVLQAQGDGDIRPVLDAIYADLATQDITIPNMPHTLAFGRLLQDKKIREGKSNSYTLSAAEAAEDTAYPRPERSYPHWEKEASPDTEEHRANVMKHKSETMASLANMPAVKQSFLASVMDYLTYWMTRMPPPLRERYRGLYNIEAKSALLMLGEAAHVATGNGSEQDKEIYALLHDAAGKARMSMPRLIIVESDLPNGRALNFPHMGINGSVLVTTGAIDLLGPKEMEALLLHELRHVKDWDWKTLRAVPQGIAYAARYLRYRHAPEKIRGTHPMADMEENCDASAIRALQDDMPSKDMEIKFTDRCGEYQAFAQEFMQVIDRNCTPKQADVILRALPFPMRLVLSIGLSPFPMMDKDEQSRYQRIRSGRVHPAHLERIENANRTADKLGL